MNYLNNIPLKFWQILVVLLFGYVLFSHLGYLPIDVDSDEPRRGLVALEMIFSGDYITPTLNGEPYFNKPPFYNWLIALSFKTFGNYSPFAMRFPMAVSLVIYGLIIYWFTKKYTNQKIGFLAALVFVSNGRILFYDSLQGLIDICFSMTTFLGFMLSYTYFKEKKWLLLFVFTYLLTAVGFLMKGLPALVFQGITLVTLFVWKGNFKKLFCWQHWVGGLVFLGIIASYYGRYFGLNQIPLEKMFGILLSESTNRTVLKFGWQDSLAHMISFPFEMLYHYAPWMILVVVLMRKDIKTILRENEFISYLLWIFFTNFIIYWTSPQVYARYLLMLLPLVFIPFVWIWEEKTNPIQWQRKSIEMLFGIISILLCLGVWVFPFHPETQNIPNVFLKSSLFFVLLLGLTYAYFKLKSERIFVFIFITLSTRLIFNFLVLPPRINYPMTYLPDIERVANKTIGKALYAYKYTVKDNGSEDFASYYFSSIRGQILKNTYQKHEGAFYIADEESLKRERNYIVLDSCYIDNDLPVKLIQFTK
ncbi:MAG: glycosyltransferase family 39 protein [Bacteroidia bacterium]|nr:glycosyltransferase family 39 protein [Bacteroidia bacterium]MCF8448202.1 glycosyltransferase family 39 protein [Bacteroidia bacterium]